MLGAPPQCQQGIFECLRVPVTAISCYCSVDDNPGCPSLYIQCLCKLKVVSSVMEGPREAHFVCFGNTGSRLLTQFSLTNAQKTLLIALYSAVIRHHRGPLTALLSFACDLLLKSLRTIAKFMYEHQNALSLLIDLSFVSEFCFCCTG